MYYKTRIKTYSRLKKTKKLGKRNLKFRNTKMRRKNNRKSSRKNKYKGGAPIMRFHIQPRLQQYQRPLSTDHTQEALTIGGIQYQGVDIFILTKIDDTICIILFVPIDPITRIPLNTVNMPGGRLEKKHATLEEVASQELFEESACSIIISKSEFRKTLYYDLVGSKVGIPGKRRTYVVSIPYTVEMENIYYENLEKIKKDSNIDKSYSETSDIVFIPIQSIIDLIAKSHHNRKQYPKVCTDIANIYRNIDWRIFKIVENLQRTNKKLFT